ncbi:PREDICTED: 60S acidic ribosomal protein P0-like [Amphimedon queenslandica]|uniref:60S acidic ribosomal protein P0 n=2 Tax=Amphimedon queenslandica TaxID=400682 RepID=A0AAN0IC49_AMPQE|nr:PREDICTED: 60S acidic ribosomal protein P0-like [Amphimedon queenslandica]|eukprot:XP_003384811.1 PREDICTED: 60S acidic ribosomal protein P0-like [Amphimedon queenslandica]
MGREDKATWKANYALRLMELFSEYSKVFIVGADNVGSKQMQQIRISLRGKGILLMGKNTTIRKIIRSALDTNPQLEKLLPHVKGNIGFVFTHEDLKDVRDLITDNKVSAPAKAGALAPIDVKIPPQNTGLGPEKTSFFQALRIQTKIARGTIEILGEVHIIKKDEKVGASEATLLQMLKIMPFSYGLVIFQVYDSGSVFSPDVLDISDDDLLKKFMLGVTNVASVSLAIGYPTTASVPHSIVNGFKNLLAIAVATDINFKEAEELKTLLSDPEALAAAMAASAAAAPKGGGEEKEEEKKEEAKKDESDEDSDDGMGFDLFGDD